MKKMYVYYGSLALKALRKARKMTVAQLASPIPCSERTVNRFEASNWTSNKQTAEKLAEIFSIPFAQLFILEEQHLLEALETIAPNIPLGPPMGETTYYLLSIRRISWWDANIWGKTMWIGFYDQFHELRKLHMLSKVGSLLIKMHIKELHRVGSQPFCPVLSKSFHTFRRVGQVVGRPA